MKKQVERPTWCDVCNHVIPKGEFYYLLGCKLYCWQCKEKLDKEGEKNVKI